MTTKRPILAAIPVGLCLLAGCSDGPGPGGELPPEVAKLLPTDHRIRHREGRNDQELDYRLWLAAAPAPSLLQFPKGLKGFESHVLPGNVLAGVFAARVPATDVAPLRGGTCRYSHFEIGEFDCMIREAVVGGEWLATIETIRK